MRKNGEVTGAAGVPGTRGPKPGVALATYLDGGATCPSALGAPSTALQLRAGLVHAPLGPHFNIHHTPHNIGRLQFLILTDNIKEKF